MNAIIDAVAREYLVSAELIRGRSRTSETAEARQVCYCLARSLGWTFSAIGRAMQRDHGAVMHGIRTIRNLIEVDARTLLRLERLRHAVAARLSTTSLDCSML